MNRRRAISLAAAILFTLPAMPSAFAWQAEAPPAPEHSLPTVDEHLRILTQKLDLTQQQQEKARPIITDMQTEMQKIEDDKTLSQDEASSRRHAVFMKADSQFRELLTDDQKARLTELEQQMHSGSHTQSDAPSPH